MLLCFVTEMNIEPLLRASKDIYEINPTKVYDLLIAKLNTTSSITLLRASSWCDLGWFSNNKSSSRKFYISKSFCRCWKLERFSFHQVKFCILHFR